jgi:hypothetical protein
MGASESRKPRRPPERYRTLASFYNADPRRIHSRERDIGLWWREGAEGPLHRAAWVNDTGELYLVRLGPRAEGGGTVELLATVADRERLESVLAGWRERCGDPRSLSWLRERARAQALLEPGYRGRPSSGIASHAAAQSTNCRYAGRMPGSRSRVPSLTTTSSSENGSPLKTAEPQFEQNHLGTPVGGS